MTITPGARAAAAELTARTGVDRHDVALVLGSGWTEAVGTLGTVTAAIPVDELVGFRPPAVAGHGSSVLSVAVDGHHLLAFTGRTHYYESRDVEAVAHAVRVAAACGCRVVVLTNACGALREDLAPGQLVLVSDHINLTGASPLLGATFVDLTDLYSARLRARVRRARPDVPEGVYAGYWGPNYETPAEIRAYRILGADLVGMSTVLEAIAARAAGMEVLAISLVTNRAAGLAERLSHEDVIDVAAASAPRAAALLREILVILAGARDLDPPR